MGRVMPIVTGPHVTRSTTHVCSGGDGIAGLFHGSTRDPIYLIRSTLGNFPRLGKEGCPLSAVGALRSAGRPTSRPRILFGPTFTLSQQSRYI